MTDRNRRLLRLLLRFTLGVVVLVLMSAVALWLAASETMGGRVEGERLVRATRSPQWRDGHFDNRLPRVDGSMLRAIGAFAFGGSPHRVPEGDLPVVRRRISDYSTPPSSGLRVTWLGHSTLLLEIDGRRVLIDPVWGERASPFTFLGPRRFFAPPLAISELPVLDAVVISHDHYDHLDVSTVKALAERGVRWIVPLGVGAHLEAWGVGAQQIVELDWWEATELSGLTISATPARHFSGRSLSDANRTLWSGWAFVGPVHRAYYSGDTALDDQFAEIGRRLGPFDLTMIEAGAYDALWADVHLGPEQAVLAHQLVRGDVMLPVHWGLFDLALHGWTEPMERVIAAAERAGVRVASPRPGEMVEPRVVGVPTRWWPAVPWRSGEEAPVWSTGVEQVLRLAPVTSR